MYNFYFFFRRQCEAFFGPKTKTDIFSMLKINSFMLVAEIKAKKKKKSQERKIDRDMNRMA